MWEETNENVDRVRSIRGLWTTQDWAHQKLRNRACRAWHYQNNSIGEDRTQQEAVEIMSDFDMEHRWPELSNNNVAPSYSPLLQRGTKVGFQIGTTSKI
ncbi:hypothetical protein GCM10009720_06250 [Yaniella flava]|uniref:Uncharacterized protein n=1 Tax=Yaniella flava TaxID=287930 RepID=A0ABN2U5G8_9MICC